MSTDHCSKSHGSADSGVAGRPTSTVVSSASGLGSAKTPETGSDSTSKSRTLPEPTYRKHRDLVVAVMREIGSRPDVRLITIKQGAGVNSSGTFQQFGARKGVSDIIGILKLTGSAPHGMDWTVAFSEWQRRSGIGCALGACETHPIGIWLAFECKVGNDRLSREQAAFLDMINSFGGIGREIRSVADCLAVLP